MNSDFSDSDSSASSSFGVDEYVKSAYKDLIESLKTLIQRLRGKKNPSSEYVQMIRDLLKQQLHEINDLNEKEPDLDLPIQHLEDYEIDQMNLRQIVALLYNLLEVLQEFIGDV
jgi:hypothetical protein